jgi:hypothetical protein
MLSTHRSSWQWLSTQLLSKTTSQVGKRYEEVLLPLGFMLCQVIRYQANKEIIRDLVTEINEGVKREYERRAKLSALEKEAEDLYQTLMLDVLPIRCPGCKAQFFDFTGCFSVTCHCGCVFVCKTRCFSL